MESSDLCSFQTSFFLSHKFWAKLLPVLHIIYTTFSTTEMDTKTPQYQRAVTPSIVDSNASPSLVRGKVLSYNTNIIRGGRGTTSVSDKLFGSLNPVPSPSLSSAGATLSPRGGSGKLGTQSGKYISENIAGAHIDSLATAFSVLPRNDLVPISSELPSDGIIFAKTKTLPEMLVVFRTTEERLRNPERLNLDRRQLEVCPLLEQEQRLRLLNFQNNSIRVIQNLENLPNLIFLDLYNNKISSLEGPLSAVKGLRVLMAGKNKISTISNLHPLRKLDVLDLHSNEIRVIEGLDGLADLRVLNLAGTYEYFHRVCSTDMYTLRFIKLCPFPVCRQPDQRSEQPVIASVSHRAESAPQQHRKRDRSEPATSAAKGVS